MKIAFNVGNERTAFSFFDMAVNADSTNLQLLEVAGSWERGHNNFDRCFKTTMRQIRLAPQEPLFQLRAAMIFERNGDTINSRQYLAKAIKLYTQSLDTLKNDTFEYSSAEFNLAYANSIYDTNKNPKKYFLDLYTKNPSPDLEVYKNMSRNDLIQKWFSNE